MRAALLLDLDEVKFIEPSFDRLIEPQFTNDLVNLPSTRGRLVINENEWPIAVALETDDGWVAGSFTYRNVSEELLDKLEQIDIEIYQERQSEWESAVREYYSLMLMRNTAPALDDFSQNRVENLLQIIKEEWVDVRGNVCLDAACGTGIGSMVARTMGMAVISFDNDPSLLSCGLRAGRLLPEETMCIDASLASRFVRSAGYGLILMAGEITPFNSLLWKRIVNEILSLTEHTIITTGTEREASLIRQWSEEKGRKAELFQNEMSDFYDQWICKTWKR
ncbi:MAG: hypothetical protein QHH00_07635 [Methanomassiliicoccales archaeon]|jgi:hypothetical protein|nr:hypothetical protein [Methanomassiliicoccales archaeon]